MTTKLWLHQEEDLENSWMLPYAAIYWEPRLGKSRLIIETAYRLWKDGKINACLVISPNGVHLNWTRDQIPLYWKNEDPLIIEWKSSSFGTKKQTSLLEEGVSQKERFVWFSCNVEAVATPKLGKYVEKFVRKNRCLLVVDESHYIKNNRAKRTRAVMRLSEKCPYKRNLTGTPTPHGPFDLWSQYYVLNPEILGYRFVPFKQRYGIWRRMKYGNRPSFDELVSYKNLDELLKRIAPCTFERKKKDCLDLPDRLFIKEHFELPESHRKIYDKLRIELIAKLDSGEEISAPQALVNLLRLQQISRGNVNDELGNNIKLNGPFPAIERVISILKEKSTKAIIWCRFVSDVEMLLEEIKKEFGVSSVAGCVGSTPVSTRVELREKFLNDESLRFWVGTIGTGGIGVDLGVAPLMIFYSHGFDLGQRLQGLERNYGSSQKADHVEVIDLVSVDTVDEKVLSSLERKENLSAKLSMERYRELLG